MAVSGAMKSLGSRGTGPAMTPSDLLVSAIEEERPIVLILGQDAWAESENGDTLLASALDKLGRNDRADRGWSALLDSDPVDTGFYDWLAERFNRRVHSPSLEVLSELPWWAVFTSALDPTFSRLLASQGREPRVVLTESETPEVARSRIRPPLYYLFSRAGESEPNAQPPTSRIELNVRRTNHAMPLLRRALEAATTLGLVVVDGFVSGRDWFKIEDLLGILGSAMKRQVIWCGGLPRIEGEMAEVFDELVEVGSILVEPRCIGTLVAELRALDRLDGSMPPESDDVGVVSLADNKVLETTPEERLRVEAVASIVDDSWTAFLPPLGRDAEYETFRRFHGDLEGPRLLVEGVRRGFAIERSFERDLIRRVNAAIAAPSRFKTPIIVEGQSGTGKSVALARIVATIRGQKLAPILYSVGRIPRSQEVSSFCESAEKAGAKVTLLVCDANRDVDQYHELLTGLRGRGRRVVVLGSQYRVADGADFQQHKTVSLHESIQASAQLSNAERHKLAALLKAFLDFNTPSPAVKLEDQHILAFLYRFLPASRPRIGAGLGTEARVAEQSIRSAVHEDQPVRSLNQIQQALIKAGLIGDDPTLDELFSEEETKRLEADGEDTAGRIIDLVMVAGSLNCPIPVNLLIRAVTKDSHDPEISQVSDSFQQLDLFRWEFADPEGSELLIVPRLTLEAQVICKRRLGGAEGEASRLLDLVSSVRGAGVDWGGYEVRFLLDLLQQIGADGLRGQRYKHAYVDIARQLTSLRTKHGIVDASLMLQESAFRRSAIRCDVVDEEERRLLLEEARNAVRFALDGIANGSVRAGRRTEQNLRVEHATLYGFLARNLADCGNSNDDVWSSYEAARTAVHEAVSTSDSYYPLDVGLWLPSDLFMSGRLTESHRTELAADIYSTLDQVQPDSLPPKQRERFESRRMRLGEVLKDHDLADDAYNELEKSGSTAGYFLRAREYISQLDRESFEVSDHGDLTAARHAFDFLDKRFDKIEADRRCLSLLLDCWWISRMKRWPLPLRGERQPLPVNSAARRDVLEIVRALNQASGETPLHLHRYLEAVLTWLVGDEPAARQAFRELEIETDYEFSGRVVRRHVITDACGKPRRFEGRVQRERSESHWVIRVGELNREVFLLSRDFPYESIAKGRTIVGFGVAFNFIGPIADPVRRQG